MTEEKNKRLAHIRHPDGTTTERAWTPAERYQLYAKGFRDGAGVRPIDSAREGLGAYDRGYDDGIKSRRAAVAAYAAEIGYVPTVLRAEESPTPEIRPPSSACRRCFDPNSGRNIGCPSCHNTGVDPLHPTGRCTCFGEGRCAWCLRRKGY